MDIFFLFLPAVIVLANYLIADLRHTSANVSTVQVQGDCFQC